MSQISASSSMRAGRSSTRVTRPTHTPYKGQFNLNFKNPSHRVIYNELLHEKQVEPTITINEDTLVELGIYEPFVDMFRQAELISLATYSGKTYEYLIREFISSFDVKRVGACVVEWQFRMGNRNFSYNRERLSEVLAFPENGTVPQYSEIERVQFWGRITGMHHYKGDMSPKCIREGLWKCAHRVIALAINTRRDTGSMVTKKDLDIMLAMSRHDRIDCTQLLADRFLEWKDVRSKNRVLGGAPFMAMIAKEERFDLSGCEGIYKPLDADQMVHTQMFLPSKIRS